MSSSTHQIAVKGVDQTGKAFQSIQARAISTGNRIASMMGGAIAAAGAYLSVRAFTNGAKELGKLSDEAMKAGMSVEELTASSTAFQVAGLNLSVETLTKSMQYLQKNTGQGGMDNFYKTLEGIAKIEDPAERGAELMKNFGRAGMELQPLVNGGADAIAKMRELQGIMPSVSQSAADAGDKAADAMQMLGDGMKAQFLEAVGKIAAWLDEKIPGGLRAGALKALAWTEWLGKAMMSTFNLLGTKIFATGALVYDSFIPALKLVGGVFEKIWQVAEGLFTYLTSAIGSVVMLLVDSATKGPAAAWEVFKGTWSEMNKDFTNKMTDWSMFDGPIDQINQALDVWNDTIDQAGKDFDKTMMDAANTRDAQIDKINKANVDKLASALGSGGAAGEEAANKAAKAAGHASNKMIMGGSYAALKMGMQGPTLQGEMKKQTSVQKNIEKYTKKISEKQNDSDVETTDLGF